MWLNCLILSDTNHIDWMTVVEIDDNAVAARLNQLIKQQGARRLVNIDASDLDLWTCSIPADDKLQETLNNIRFDNRDDRLHHLSPFSLVSEHFVAGLSPKTVHILVRIPPLGKHGTCIS